MKLVAKIRFKKRWQHLNEMEKIREEIFHEKMLEKGYTTIIDNPTMEIYKL